MPNKMIYLPMDLYQKAEQEENLSALLQELLRTHYRESSPVQATQVQINDLEQQKQKLEQEISERKESEQMVQDAGITEKEIEFFSLPDHQKADLRGLRDSYNDTFQTSMTASEVIKKKDAVFAYQEKKRSQ